MSLVYWIRRYIKDRNHKTVILFSTKKLNIKRKESKMQSNDFYEALKDRLKEKINPTAYLIWVQPISLYLSNGILEISCNSKLRCDVVKNESGEFIKAFSKDLLGFDVILTFHVTDDKEQEYFEEDDIDNTPVCEFKKSDDEISRDIKLEISKHISLKAYNEWIKDADLKAFEDFDGRIVKIHFCFSNEFKANIASHFYKKIRASVNAVIQPVNEIEIVYGYYSENGAIIDIDFHLEEIEKEGVILHYALNYIKEVYKYSIDPFVYDLLFKEIKIHKIDNDIIYLNLEHKFLCETLQNNYSKELIEAFSEAMNADVTIRYTVDGDDYTH